MKGDPSGREANGLMLMPTVKCTVLDYGLPFQASPCFISPLDSIQPRRVQTESLAGAWGQEAELNLLRL